jgi:hypothetical protein
MRNGVVLPHPEGPTNQSLNGCFVMMRDDNNRHPNNKLWGDGWGWSWFNSDILLAPYSSLVSAVACHPAKNIVAVGYADGMVLLVRLPDGAEILLKAPDRSSIAAMRWSRSGKRLGIASENRECRVITTN